MPYQPIDPTFYSIAPSPLGPIYLMQTDKGLCGAWFEDEKHFQLHKIIKKIEFVSKYNISKHIYIQKAHEQLDEYFKKKRKIFDIPLDLQGGSIFQQRVWHALLRVPFGESSTYGDIAKAVNNPKGPRAAGMATGRNPVSIIVPCHRILGINKAITGYAGGLDRKRALLHLEGIDYKD